MLNLCISATASNQGKTILTTALLWHFRESVRPFKIGPDFIDPQFHKRVCGTDSVNLDSFIMNEEQVAWLYHHYANKKVAILEGVMGFYDGDNKGCSAYSVSKLLHIPTILVLDGGGSYITISAVLKGLLEYKSDNTIKAVVLNNLSSKMHYMLIKNQIEADHKDIEVLGWIQKKLPALSDTHLGLDLNDLSKIEQISQEVLEHIDLEKLSLLEIGDFSPKQYEAKAIVSNTYPFPAIKKIDKKLAIVNDINFSFLYYDNLKFLQELFSEVVIIDSTKDEVIPKDADMVYICGGYVETDKAYERVKNSHNFKNSLIKHAKTKTIYAECAGLLYLSNGVDNKQMSGILDIEFTLDSRFNRLGYYYNEQGVKGHAFHYTKPTQKALESGFDVLSKTLGGKGVVGSWAKNKVWGTYLHGMFRVQNITIN
ncbi:Cobyrinic acid A,C-diamide synthase [hydrothermal vent metagenome]|uniref:Cobyrinic acid A,C-diamide synthase n=1 Tax=hydrothermal vent metagenome TaxID=652676 RepID=A0A1W1CY15_9ZZZZ